MSGTEGGSPHRLVAELAATLGAVPALVALYDGGGCATDETLVRACGNKAGAADEAIRWLTSVGLLGTASAGASVGSPTLYELTDVGHTLTKTLIDLAQALAE